MLTKDIYLFWTVFEKAAYKGKFPFQAGKFTLFRAEVCFILLMQCNLSAAQHGTGLKPMHDEHFNCTASMTIIGLVEPSVTWIHDFEVERNRAEMPCGDLFTLFGRFCAQKIFLPNFLVGMCCSCHHAFIQTSSQKKSKNSNTLHFSSSFYPPLSSLACLFFTSCFMLG